MWDQRARRARLLAERYPASREVLTFYAGLADWQGQANESFENLRNLFPSLRDLVIRTGPPALSEAAREMTPEQMTPLPLGEADAWERSSRDELKRRVRVSISEDFFARAILQTYFVRFPAGLDCPWCVKPPQVGCLHPQGEGLALELVCALCLRRRPFPRTRCPGCNESSEKQLANFTAPDFPHLRVHACDTCHGYLLVVDLSRDPAAIPEVDELAGLPLDLWAIERGYHKLQPNLAGM